MSDTQKAKARLRYMDPANPVRIYVAKLESQLAKGPKKREKIMKLRSEISRLERENLEFAKFAQALRDAIRLAPLDVDWQH